MLTDAAPGARLIQFASESVSQILVAGKDDREEEPCVAVIVLKELDEKQALQSMCHHHYEACLQKEMFVPFSAQMLPLWGLISVRTAI